MSVAAHPLGRRHCVGSLLLQEQQIFRIPGRFLSALPHLVRFVICVMSRQEYGAPILTNCKAATSSAF